MDSLGFFQLLGGDPYNNRWVIQEAVTIFMVCDVLHDLIHDVKRGIVWVPQDALVAHELSLADLKQLCSWEEAGHNPCFVAWYSDQTYQVAERWSSLKGSLCTLMEALVPQEKLRALFIAVVSKQFDKVLELCQQRSQHLTQTLGA